MKIFCIPDVQAKPGHDFKYLKAVGSYIAEKQPQHVVMMGDWADMASLSSYDRGKRAFEGRRYKKDIDASMEAMDVLLEGMEYNGGYKGKKKLLYGNHEERIIRATNDNPELHGLIGLEDLCYEKYGWETFQFLKPIIIGGVVFCHYFVSGPMGRPVASAQRLITTKHQSCIAGHQQGRQVAYGFRADGKSITSIIAGSCLTPDHKVLTADLRYVPLSEIVEGDSLLSFEENVTDKRSRRYKKGVVEAIKFEPAFVYKVTLESGKVFKVTSDHRWFVKTGSKYYWKTTDTLRKGTKIPRLLPEWKTDTSYDAGWLSGIYDGEGHLYQRKTSGGGCVQMGLSQKEGLVMARARSILNNRLGVNSTTYTSITRDVGQLRLAGGVPRILQVLGSIRPLRLLSKLDVNNIGRIHCSDDSNDAVLSIQPLGEMTVCRIAVDTKTMVVEGYGHHNCYEHDEDYMGPQGNKHWRGIIGLHEVKDGEYDEMFVSLNFLKGRYK